MDELISKQAAIDSIMEEPLEARYPVFYAEKLRQLSPAQPEITDADVQEYCRKRDFVVITYDLFHEMQRRWSKTAQPERKKGKWIWQGSISNGCWVCSECKHKFYQGCGNENFCPNCGKYMRKEVEDERNN